MKKWSLFSVLRTQSSIFWHLKMGSFAKSAQLWVPKDGTSGARSAETKNVFSTSWSSLNQDYVPNISLGDSIIAQNDPI